MQLTRPSALLFDMDGTLTRPMLDFPAIKAEMGIGEEPILEAMARMTLEQRATAAAILLRHEDRAAAESTLNDGCEELLKWIDEQRLPLALITRNCRRSVDVVMSRHDLRIDVVITRDDGLFKPDPSPLLLACEKLGAAPSRAWMIGDGEHDIDAAAAAGMTGIWLSHGKMRGYADKATLIVKDLRELLNVLDRAVSNK